ncbi:hypothetical protein MANES_01G081400v8 [Manihot esculenta]|uniref:Uncharacterized protein n=5 Tax=Manihot esculenta TaxID=3983 RepID=A0ACB7IGL2_MANES|nr:hypothetical protein MANES_01G081400v8 [Manihot esculenta]KAG8662261.1 hypothetical protein MANES_01G081400v8 [Manihot esculenta]KAG8662262.1 hypothetical protein MANES_01G081400v8 [Manihot esculenta]OAY60040.1 hypothetical protein MANES_01G081400v8 [Manihot esculenta]
MDYDDNDLQSQSFHLAGEGSNKFPPVLQPYALPKFDFDDSLHGTLRFDSLVETEVFLGIENNEDSQWIEDFSRGSSGIQFSPGAAESCSISRCNNVWSEATSSESVEMLLKSVGLEEHIPAQINTKESDGCDELGCIVKQMEPSSKQDTSIPARVVGITSLQPTLQPGEIPEKFSVLNDDGGQQPQVEDSSQIHQANASGDPCLGDLTAISVEVRLASAEGSHFSDDKCNDVNEKEVDTVINESFDNRTQEGSSPVKQTNNTFATAEVIITSNDGLINEGLSNHINEVADKNEDVSGTDMREHLEEGGVLSQGLQMHALVLNAEVDERDTSHLNNPLCMTSEESMEEATEIENNMGNVEEPNVTPKEDSGLEMHVHSVVPLLVVEGNTTVERHEIEKSDPSDIICAEDKVDESSGHAAVNYSLPEVCYSAEFINETHAECHVSLPAIVDCMQMCEENEVPKQCDVDKCDKDVPVTEQKESMHLEADVSESNKITDKEVGTSEGSSSTENELLVSKPQSESTAGNESALDFTSKSADLSCNTLDDVPESSKNGNSTDAVIDHKDVNVSYLPLVLACSDREDENVAKISSEASLSDHKASYQVTTVSEPEQELSTAAEQMMCEPVDNSVAAENACKTERQIEPLDVVIEKVSQDCTKDKELCPAPCDSTANEGDSIEALVEENDDKKARNVSEPTVDSEMLGPSALKESCPDSNQKGQEEHSAVVPRDNSFQQPAVQSSNVEHGSSADLDKAAGGSPTVIRTTDLSRDESNKEELQRSSDQSVSVSEVTDGDVTKIQSASKDPPSQHDASKDENSFTFEVSPMADLPRRDSQKWRPFSNTEGGKASPIVDGSTSSSGFGQLDPKIAQGITHGSPKVPDVAVARGASKGSSERKTRRASGKATAKETAKKGNPVKVASSVRSERGDKTTHVSLSPSGVSQLVQSSEMQHHGHVDSSNVKPPFVLATSTSGLPDLNSSILAAAFQQPFTDVQQVQLRAQIFVYGALIQGTPPDEAYMISAFGGPDGSRSIWEKAWRLCIERLHSQKSHLITPETPLQSRSGARAPEQSSKQSALQSMVSSPAVRGSSKGATIVNPIVPPSSPLWSMPTPGDTLQTSGMPRSPVMDYQRALSPLHPHQGPVIRNFVGHGPSWLSQAPFGGPWVASPQASALDTSGRFSVQLPITETVQLTPVKESSVPHSSGAKPTVPMVQSATSAGVSVLDAKMVTAAANQTSADPKPRKRKKTSVSENPGQNVLPPPHVEPIIASVVANPVSTPIASTTPVGFFPKAPTEKFITSVTPTSSDLMLGVQNVETRAISSEDTLGKIKEARLQAEDAAALAASAATHSQEIWDQLDRQKNSGLLPDVETKLASAAVAIAAAAAVAKAAAAAAKVASDAAMQAKLMAEEAVVSCGHHNPSQLNVISLSDGMKIMGKATPASILQGGDGTNSSSSILVAAKEAARRNVETTLAASKRAENMDAIVKAAELAAEAVSQAGKIVAMGDPLSLSELVAAGPGGYWKVGQVTSELVSKSNDIGGGNMNVGSGGGPDTSTRQLKEVASDEKGNQISDIGKSPTSRVVSSEEHGRLLDGVSGSCAITAKDAKGQKGRKASDLTKTIGVVPESEKGAIYSTVQNEYGKGETLKENSIKESSIVEVFKDGSGFKAAWFPAKVLSLKEGKAYVSYTELASGEASEKLKEWVPLKGEGDEAPKIRVARPHTAMPFEGTRKRRRAAIGDYNWSVGDRVDAWIQDSWWEGVVTEQSKKDQPMVTVNFPAQGETAVLKPWELRPSLIWKDEEWIEWSNSGEKRHSSHGVDTPQVKRPRVRSPVVEAKGKGKASRSIDAMESDKSDDPTLLDLSADEKLFNIGKSTKVENRPGSMRMTRTGLQKQGSRVIFGVPKPGKKRKFMEVSKHYVADRSSQLNEANDSVKSTKHLMPQGAGSRGWKNTKAESNERRTAIPKPKVVKSAKPQNVSVRTIPQKDNPTSAVVAPPDDGAVAYNTTKAKDSLNHGENTLEKQNLMGFQSFSVSDGAIEGPVLFSALALPSDSVSSKKMYTSNTKPERMSKGKLAPAGGKLSKIEEDKPLNGNSTKSTSDPVEPRRSNRRIQPTSRLLEGLQSSLMVSKIPSASHDKSHKSRNASRGNNNG